MKSFACPHCGGDSFYLTETTSWKAYAEPEEPNAIYCKVHNNELDTLHCTSCYADISELLTADEELTIHFD